MENNSKTNVLGDNPEKKKVITKTQQQSILPSSRTEGQPIVRSNNQFRNTNDMKPRRNNNANPTNPNSNSNNTGQIKLLTRQNDKNTNSSPGIAKLTYQNTEVLKSSSIKDTEIRSNNGVAEGTMKSRKITLPFQIGNNAGNSASDTSMNSPNDERTTTTSNDSKPRSAGSHKEKDPRSSRSTASPRAEHQKQVQNMLATGARRKQGIVITMKSDFGFIKPEDQPDEIYFRLRDVVSSSDQPVKITEVSPSLKVLDEY